MVPPFLEYFTIRINLVVGNKLNMPVMYQCFYEAIKTELMNFKNARRCTSHGQQGFLSTAIVNNGIP